MALREHFLQREAALRAFQWIKLQAPVDGGQKMGRVLTSPGLGGRDDGVVFDAFVGALRRRAGQTGVHAGAYAVDVAPRTERLAAGELLGRGESRCVHRLEDGRVGHQRLPGGAEVEQHRRAVGAQVDVGRFDVQVQKLVGVDFAQAVEHAGEHAANEALANAAFVFLDVVVEGSSPLELHHHVNGAVGAEEVEHAHDVGMDQLGERPAFLEKTLHPVAEGALMGLGHVGCDFAVTAQGQRVWQVFLDGDRRAVLVVGEVDDREAAKRQLSFDPVVVELKTGREGAVLLSGHQAGRYTSSFGGDRAC